MKRRSYIAGTIAAALPGWWPFSASNDSDQTDESMIEPRVSELEDQVAELDSALQALAGRVQTNETDITELDTRVSDLETQDTTSSGGATTTTYTGDATIAREIDVGYQPAAFVVQRDDMAAEYEGIGVGANSSIRVAGGSLSNDISLSGQVYASQNGVTVGDGGTDANEDGVSYKLVTWPPA